MFKRIRTRLYLAVEGEGEQAFIKWLQQLSDDNNLFVHLDCQVLHGGGYEHMLDLAYRYRQQKAKVKTSVLLIDSDRAQKNDDSWSIEKLKQQAKKKQFHVCVQEPNQEGWLLRLIRGNENLRPDITCVDKALKKCWPNYKKPVAAHILSSKFSLEDLIRVANIDVELNALLSIIGLKKGETLPRFHVPHDRH